MEEEEESNDGDTASVASHCSTKKPLPRKRKSDIISQENFLLEQAVSVFCSKKENKDDPENIFSKHVAVVLRPVSDIKNRELAKLKIQEILFQAQFGMLGIPIQQNETNLQFQSTPMSSFVPRPS